MKIEIKTIFGGILFEYDIEGNTVRKTVEALLKKYSGKAIRDADLSNLDLSFIQFDNSKFYNSKFDNSKFYNSTFYNSTFDNSKFDNSKFDNSKFYNSTFYNSTFYNSTFYNSTFDNSTFDNSKFDNSKFYNSKFDSDTLKNIRNAGEISMFNTAKHHFWSELLRYKKEIAGLKEAILAGKIKGTAYEGECACFKGTIANIKKCHYTTLSPDSSSPTEQWFLNIGSGDTPDKSEAAKITIEWIEEFEALLNA